jgi:alanine transaminase
MSGVTETETVLTLDNINPHVRAAQYAVRGELAVKSEEYRAKLAKGEGKDLPFDTVIAANIGNPQQLDQKPITFFRQVASLLENPLLLEHEHVLTGSLGYQKDVIQRAQKLLNEVHSVGAYSQSQGAPGIRKSVAEYIERRDGYPSTQENIYLSNGASSGVNTLLHVICASPSTGIMVPIPQYPLYTATLSVLNARCVPYYLDEAANWGTSMSAIQESYDKAKSEGTDVKAICIINPGNPTGASLPAEDIKSVLKFAAKNKLVVIADASLHSVSKGMVGECGHRGGYFELVGFHPDVAAEIYKFISIQLCPPVLGQCIVEMMVNPPKEGEPSYELYKKEYDGIFAGLKKRAYALYEAFKKMEGVEVGEPQVSTFFFLYLSRAITNISAI